MKEKKRALNVELTLEGEVKERFRAIKRAKGLTDDEVLRLIINEYFEKKPVGGRKEAIL